MTLVHMQVTKLKSRQVLYLLQKGYDVLFSDVDVVWFSDPLPSIQATYAEDALLVQVSLETGLT